MKIIKNMLNKFMNNALYKAKKMKKEHFIREYFKNNVLFVSFVITVVLNATLLRFFCMHSIENYLSHNRDEYTKRMSNELTEYRSQYTTLFNSYSSATVTFNEDYKRVTNSNISVKSITTSTREESVKAHPFSTEMNKIPTAVFFYKCFY